MRDTRRLNTMDHDRPRRTRRGRSFIWLISAGFLLLIIAALLGFPHERAHAQGPILVSNTGQTHDPSETELVGGPFRWSEQYSLAQRFRTAKDGGATLGSVELYLSGVGNLDEPRVSIYNSRGLHPGSSIYVLTNPSTFVYKGLNTFTAPPRATLAADTTYYVVVEATAGAFGVGTTDEFDVDAESENDWSIGGTHEWRRFDHSNWHRFTPPLRIAVRAPGPNTAATGQPSISGAARVGTMLVAGQGTLTDREGLPLTFPDDYTFQWVRGEAEEITGATSRTYKPVAADMGKTIKVKVSFTDARGEAEGPIESNATAAVTTAREIPGTVLLDTTLTIAANGSGCNSSIDYECDEQLDLHTFSSTDSFGVQRTFTITMLYARALVTDPTQQRLWFMVSSDTRLSDHEKHRLVLVLDGWRFAFRTANSLPSSSIYKFWNDTLLPWTPGQEVNVKIIDADNPPSSPRVPSARVADSEANETDGAIEFKVTLNRPLDGDRPQSRTVTVSYATSDGSAVAGEDYVHKSGTLTFPGKETEKTVSVRLINDGMEDDGETFDLILSNAQRATIADPVATGTIRNTELLTASFENVPESHDGSTAFSLRVSFSEDLAAEGAVGKLGQALSLSGATRGTVSRVEERLDLYEFPVQPSGTDAVTVSLSATTDCAANDALCTADGKALSQTLSATVAGPPVTPALSVADASATEGSAVVFTVSLSPASTDQVTVAYATSGASATSGTDFTASSGTLTFAANETSKTVSVATTDDTTDEENETFTLTLSSPTNATLGTATATGTINDNDATPLTASFADVPASHDGSNAFTFTLSFSEDVGGLSYSTLRDSAFGVTGGSVTGAGRQTEGSNQHWNVRVEPDSEANVAIILPETTDCSVTGAICAPDGRKLSQAVTVTVAGPAVTPALSVADASATEGSAVVFTVSLSPASTDQVTVAYATSGGSATSGTDFTAASGTLTFAANETFKTVSVATTDDTTDEENETFTLTLSSPTNATLGTATATGTINDDDAAPLTASFENMPASHTGADFTFALVFSEEIEELGFRTLRDDAFDVTGGTVLKAKRQQEGSNLRWTITVRPNSPSDTIAITLPETTDCNADGAICADDDRPLSHSLAATIAAQ